MAEPTAIEAPSAEELSDGLAAWLSARQAGTRKERAVTAKATRLPVNWNCVPDFVPVTSVQSAFVIKNDQVTAAGNVD